MEASVREHDMPGAVAQSDTIQTLSYFQAPRVFVQPGDKRLKTDPMFLAADDTEWSAGGGLDWKNCDGEGGSFCGSDSIG